MRIIKILLAIDNKEIKERLDKKYGKRVYEHDINCMENVIEFLSNRNDEYIVITRDSLQGNLEKRLYIKQMRVANPKTKIVYIVDKLTKEYKEFLFANEVFNIIEGKSIDFDILISYIDNPQNIIYKNIDNVKNNKNRVIAICGTSGVGKSVFSSILVKDFKNLTKENIILLDMNAKNPSIDIYNNLDSNNTGLQQYIESNNFNINNYLSKKDEIYYMVNKFARKLKFNKRKIENIYKFALDNYFYTVVDLDSDNLNEYNKFWIDKATDVIVVINPNYLNIRESLRLLSNIKNKNLFVIVNSIKFGSLDMLQVKSLLSEYRIVGKIYYGKNVEGCINGAISELEVQYDFKELYSEFSIKNKINIKDVYAQTYKKFKENLERI